MSESPRSAVDRIFNMKESDFVDDSADVAEDISSKHLIFSKLLNAANGYITLCPEDADQIISVICKTMNCGGTSRPREETTATLVDLLGSTADSCDNALLTYLTTNYTRLEHQNDEEGTESTHTTPHGSATKRRTSEILQPICGELVELLDGLHEWDFNIFALETYTKSYLRLITMTCMMELNILDHIDFDEPKLENFLNEIEKSYNDNPYHNSLHAADVVQTTYHFCTKGRLIDASGMTKISTAALILAAAVHDVNHAGVTNHFLISTSSPLAIQYNDHSPLENMHLATAFGILNNPANNFMERLSPSTRKEIRRLIIAIVLATDNDRHFSLHQGLAAIVDHGVEAESPISQMISRTNRLFSVALLGDENGEFQSGDVRRRSTVCVASTRGGDRSGNSKHPLAGALFCPADRTRSILWAPYSKPTLGVRRKSLGLKSISDRDSDCSVSFRSNRSSFNSVVDYDLEMMRNTSSSFNSIHILSDTQQLLLLECVLHLADVSNPAKPWKVYCRWLDSVMAEFYNQGDKERELAMPLTFAYDRHNPVPESKFQLGFIKAIVLPLFKTFSKLNGININHCITQLDNNSIRWEYLANNSTENKES